MSDSKNIVARHPSSLKLANADTRAKIDQINQYVVRSLTFSLSTTERKKLWQPEECEQQQVIYQGMKQSELINAYRDIRTKLVKKSQGMGAIVVVTSLGSKSDHSALTAFNLATCLALDESKVSLFIDCNPYSGDNEQFCIRDMQFGITDYLTSSNVSLADITYPSGVDRLKIIPTGGVTESAAEYFNHPKMEVIISSIKCSMPDAFVIIHAPPALHYAEAAILSEKADMTVLEVPAKKATTSDIDKAVQAIGQDKIAGLVLSN